MEKPPSRFNKNKCIVCAEDTFIGEENELTSCKDAKKCGPGLEVDEETNKIIDTTCKSCLTGFWSDDFDKCKEHTFCENGVTTYGTVTNDVICTQDSCTSLCMTNVYANVTDCKDKPELSCTEECIWVKQLYLSLIHI